jgi:hypothetical protein
VLPAEEPVIWIYHVCLQVKRKSEDDTIVVSSVCAILLQKKNTLSDTLIKLDMCRRQVEKKKNTKMDSAFRNSIQKLKED